MTIIRYRLFNIGRVLFFQILEQDKRLTSGGGIDIPQTSYKISIDSVYRVGSLSRPDISFAGGDAKYINIWTRGTNKGHDMETIYRRLSSEAQAKTVINRINNAMAHHIGETLKKSICMSSDSTGVLFYEGI